jgi:hypothetical protein
MKNIHLLPTEKPSRLFKDDFGRLIYSINIDQEQNHFEPQNIYITSDEEIKEGDWIFDLDVKKVVKADNLKVTTSKKYQCWYYKKIILTTDQDLIKDGVQAIDDEFLNWFVKNPTCEKVEIVLDAIKHIPWDKELESKYDFEKGYPVTDYKIIIPKKEPTMITDWLDKHGDPEITKKVEKEAELREAAENYGNSIGNKNGTAQFDFIRGAKWQADKMYSEEEVLSILKQTEVSKTSILQLGITKWFEQFKKK